MREKKIRIMVEIPEDWVDPESPSFYVSYAVREEVDRQITKLLEKEYISKVRIPTPKITEAEVKDRMLTILAKRALESNNHDQ